MRQLLKSKTYYCPGDRGNVSYRNAADRKTKAGTSNDTVRQQQQRLKHTRLLLVSWIVFSLAIVGHAFEWLAVHIFNGIAKDLASSSALDLVMLWCLIGLHTCSEKELPTKCIYYAGILWGTGLAFMWGISGAAAIIVMAGSNLLLTGKSLLKIR